MMKIFLTVIAFIGVALMILGVFLALTSTLAYFQAPDSAWSQPRMYFEWTGMGYLGGFSAGITGLILTLIGGFLARLSYLWIILVVLGLAYCSVFLSGNIYVGMQHRAYPDIYPDSVSAEIISILIGLLPGLGFFWEGISLRWLFNK